MKYYTASTFALAGISNALPLFFLPAGLSLPSFGLPGFSGLPTGGLPGLPTGGLPGLPTGGLPGLPTGGLPGLPTGGLPGLPTGGLPGLPTGGLPGLPTGGALPTITGIPSNDPTPTEDASQTAETGSGGSPLGGGLAAGGSTENGVADNAGCTDLTVVFARGTGEPGNVGIIAGPPMFQSLRTKLGEDKVTVQGVDYPADAAGNANLGASGGPAMAEDVKKALSQCPNTKVVVAGYSQGAMVVHNAFSAQGLSSSQVAGAVLFGDPLKSQNVGDLADAKVKEFCGTSDAICGTGDNPNGGHLSYGSVADEAADFAISAAGLA